MRYKRWVERGILWKILMRLQKANVLKVKIAFMDSQSSEPTGMHPAPQKKGNKSGAGRSRGGLGTSDASRDFQAGQQLAVTRFLPCDIQTTKFDRAFYR